MDGNLEGVNVQEVAAPDATDNNVVESSSESTVEVGVTESNDTSSVHDQKQDDELNAKFAAVRRKAEEDSRKRIDGEFKRLFGNVQNPVTGRNIETYEDYLQAVEYQQRAVRDKLLEDKGIDPALIEQMINNSPVIRQAQQVLEENSRTEAKRKLEADLKLVSQIDPTIKNLDDLEKHASYQDVLRYVKNGLSLPDAFKLVNFDSISTKNSEAAKQAAINQTRSKSHLEKTSGISDSSTLVDIPESEISTWRDYYPGLSDAELKKKYNRTISN